MQTSLQTQFINRPGTYFALYTVHTTAMNSSRQREIFIILYEAIVSEDKYESIREDAPL